MNAQTPTQQLPYYQPTGRECELFEMAQGNGLPFFEGADRLR